MFAFLILRAHGDTSIYGPCAARFDEVFVVVIERFQPDDMIRLRCPLDADDGVVDLVRTMLEIMVGRAAARPDG